MKLALIVAVAFAVVAQGFAQPTPAAKSNNIIDNLVREALEYIRGLLKKNEPYTLPDVPAQKIIDTDVDIDVKVSNVRISKSSDFVVEHIENNLPNLWAKFDLKAPNPHLEADFVISGNAFKKTVSGKGSMVADLVDMDQSGFIQMGVKNHGLFIANLTLDYSLDNAKFDIKGLSVEGMTEEQVNTFLNKNLLPTLNKNKAETCRRLAAQIVTRANEIMAGKTLKEIIEWLKKFIGH